MKRTLKEVLAPSGMNPQQIAKAAGIGKVYIYGLINKGHVPRPETVLALSRATGINLFEFYLALEWCTQSDIDDIGETSYAGMTEIQKLQYIATREAIKKTILDR